MDVVTAFLNGKLEEEIYMQQPEGYVKPGEEHLVCKLEKSLYGLKQSPRCWNKAFQEYVEKIGFTQASEDACVYVRKQETLTVIAVYVDDLIILAENASEMQEIKDNLKTQFKMKDIGELHYCLGISVFQDKENKQIQLHQKQNIEKMLKKFGQIEDKTVTTPADLNAKLKKEDGVSKSVNPTQYQSMVGSLLYAAIATRPDIAQAVGVVSKFCASPTEAHLTAAKRILRYLKGTADLGLKYEKSDKRTLSGYSDADWVTWMTVTPLIFINESLTAYRKKLLSRIRNFKSECNFKFVWTHNGKIFLRESEVSRTFSFISHEAFEEFLDNYRAAS